MTLLEFKRRELKLTQAEVGKMLGINPACITQIERQHRRPWPKLRKQLAKVLKLKEAELFNDEGWPKKVKIAG